MQKDCKTVLTGCYLEFQQLTYPPYSLLPLQTISAYNQGSCTERNKTVTRPLTCGRTTQTLELQHHFLDVFFFFSPPVLPQSLHGEKCKRFRPLLLENGQKCFWFFLFFLFHRQVSEHLTSWINGEKCIKFEKQPHLLRLQTISDTDSISG